MTFALVDTLGGGNWLVFSHRQMATSRETARHRERRDRSGLWYSWLWRSGVPGQGSSSRPTGSLTLLPAQKLTRACAGDLQLPRPQGACDPASGPFCWDRRPAPPALLLSFIIPQSTSAEVLTICSGRWRHIPPHSCPAVKAAEF